MGVPGVGRIDVEVLAGLIFHCKSCSYAIRQRPIHTLGGSCPRTQSSFHLSRLQLSLTADKAAAMASKLLSAVAMLLLVLAAVFSGSASAVSARVDAVNHPRMSVSIEKFFLATAGSSHE